MDIIEIINKKKDKKELSAEELQFFVDGVCSGLIKDYQTTSLLMAICLNGLSNKETYNLTMFVESKKWIEMLCAFSSSVSESCCFSVFCFDKK